MKESDLIERKPFTSPRGSDNNSDIIKDSRPRQIKKIFTMESSDTHDKTNKYAQQVREKKGLQNQTLCTKETGNMSLPRSHNTCV